MRASNAPRHAAASAAPGSPGAVGGWRHRARRGVWIPMAGLGIYLVLVGSAALGGPGFRAPFMPEESRTSQVNPRESQAGPTQSSEPTATGTSAEPIATVSPSTDATGLAVGGADETTPVTSGGGPSPASPASTTTGAGDPTKPTPTASESAPGKSGQAPGVTKRPPKPKP